MCGLSRNPADRFATAREMAVALEAAIPLVPTDEVAAWVARLAAVSLREKRAMVARIEALSAMDDAGSAAPVLLEPGLARPRKRRRAPIVAAAILAAAAAAYAIGRLPTSSTPAAAATAVAPDPAPLASVPPSEAPKTLPPAVVPTRDAARDRPTLPPVHPRARAVSGAPVGRASACDPPFSFDDAGRKLYKESCLR
jgi:serine/threonine-protein kinase